MQVLECVACDLDGSLLNKEKKISQQDKQTIEKLKTLGIPTFICTGRPAAFTQQIMAEVGYDYPVCACNGAYAYDFSKKKVVYTGKLLPYETAIRLQRYAQEKDLSYLIYTTQCPLFDSPTSRRTLFWKEQLEKNFEPQNRFLIQYAQDYQDQLSSMEIVKVLLPYVEDWVKEEVEEIFNQDGSLEISWSDRAILDINTKGVNKGWGLRKMSQLYGFDLKSTLVLGDSFNDLSMLRVGGIPVVPQNGEEEVKQKAVYITTDHNDSPLTNAIRGLWPGLLEQV